MVQVLKPKAQLQLQPPVERIMVILKLKGECIMMIFNYFISIYSFQVIFIQHYICILFTIAHQVNNGRRDRVA